MTNVLEWEKKLRKNKFGEYLKEKINPAKAAAFGGSPKGKASATVKKPTVIDIRKAAAKLLGSNKFKMPESQLKALIDQLGIKEKEHARKALAMTKSQGIPEKVKKELEKRFGVEDISRFSVYKEAEKQGCLNKDTYRRLGRQIEARKKINVVVGQDLASQLSGEKNDPKSNIKRSSYKNLGVEGQEYKVGIGGTAYSTDDYRPMAGAGGKVAPPSAVGNQASALSGGDSHALAGGFGVRQAPPTSARPASGFGPGVRPIGMSGLPPSGSAAGGYGGKSLPTSGLDRLGSSPRINPGGSPSAPPNRLAGSGPAFPLRKAA